MAAFSITSASPSARLDVSRRGRVDFTVSNTAHRQLTAKAHVVTEGAARHGWFTVVGPQRDSPEDATHHFGVQVAVPVQAPAGSYRFRLDVVGVEDPDEYEGEGVWATIDVPPAPQGRRVPLPLLLAAIALLVIVVVVIVILVRRGPAQAKLGLTATVQSFGTVSVGQASPGSVVTISNTGSAAATLSPVFAGADPQDFKVLASTCAGAPVPAGSSCQLQVAFQPASQGARAATLTVKAANAPLPPALILTGSGQGSAATISFQPASVALTLPSSVPANVQAATIVTIKDTGGGSLKITNIKLDDPAGAFQAISACDGVTLATGQSCQVAIVFIHPGLTPQPLAARLLISDDAPSSPQVVPLSGFRPPGTLR